MNEKRFRHITERFGGLRIVVIGDLFLDRILFVNREWDELSVETGLVAYQVDHRLNAPGAAGVITNNISSLGVGDKYAINVIGNDGEGYDLCQALKATGVSTKYMVTEEGRFTPTYCKTFFNKAIPEETHRIDLRSRSRMSRTSERQVIDNLLALENKVDAIICLEQIPNGDYGVFTQPVIETLQAISQRGQVKVFVDSRFNVARFKNMIVKCNDYECLRAAGVILPPEDSVEWSKAVDAAIEKLQNTSTYPMFVSCGAAGMKAFYEGKVHHIPGFHVEGPIDICGAGDSALAGIACALCAGATLHEAAIIGNLVASIIIQQLGMTGTASLNQLANRFSEYQQQIKEAIL